jgi:hypothetical protein
LGRLVAKQVTSEHRLSKAELNGMVNAAVGGGDPKVGLMP